MIHRLNQHFINKVREATYARTHAAVSSVPNYPTCIAYLNPAASKRHEQIRLRLQRVWRGSVSDICFYNTKMVQNGIAIQHMDGSSVNLLQELQQMFAANAKFYSRERMYMYFVLDTSDIRDMQSLVNCINTACALKQAAKASNIASVLVFLLDESLQNLNAAVSIRNWMRGNQKDLNRFFDSICMISNRCGNNTTLNEYETSVVAASAMLLTNTHNNTVQTRTQSIGKLPMFTISYGGQQKPVDEISFVVLKGFCEEICSLTKEERVDAGRLAQILQLSPDGCFTITGKLQQEMMNHLPNEAELESFACIEPSDLALSQLSYAEFDKRTFGGFSDYMQSCLTLEPQLLEDTCAEYRKTLSEKIPVGVLAGLSETTVETMIFDKSRSKPNYQNMSVSEAIRDIVKHSCSDLLRERLYAVICEMIAAAKKQVEYFKGLHSTLVSDLSFLHFSPNVEPYYTEITRQYIDFVKNSNPQQLQIFTQFDITPMQVEKQLNKMIDDIIAFDQVFSDALDEEMKKRIGNADGATVAAAVHQKLLGHNTAENACWNTPYALSATYQGIMLNINVGEGTNMLFQTLKDMFEKQNIDYFNSGSSDAVESVAVFPLFEQHLFASAETANA